MSSNKLKDQCDKLWGKIIKLRAGMKSELSGKRPLTSKGNITLHPHHLNGKSNYLLRYSYLNGIACTAGEHNWGFHHAGRCEDYRNKVKRLRGEDIYDRLQAMKFSNEKVKLIFVKERLKKDLEELINKESPTLQDSLPDQVTEE